jgi:predicted Zn-ribbon and HTH transcriptional regulator
MNEKEYIIVAITIINEIGITVGCNDCGEIVFSDVYNSADEITIRIPQQCPKCKVTQS